MKGKCILIFMIVLAMGMTACSAVSGRIRENKEVHPAATRVQHRDGRAHQHAQASPCHYQRAVRRPDRGDVRRLSTAVLEIKGFRILTSGSP